MAVSDVSFEARQRRDHRGDRPERRRQDHGVQLHHRLLQADGRRACNSTHPDGATFLLERCPATASPREARVARTFQNIRLFAGMTVLENLLVAQHNTLMVASGFTVLGLFGLGTLSPAPKQRAIDKARYWLDAHRP